MVVCALLTCERRHNIILEDDPCFDPMSMLPSLDLLNSDKDLVFLQSQSSLNGISQMTPPGGSSQGSSSGHRRSFGGFGIDLPHSLHSPGSYHLPSDFGHRSSSLVKSIHEPEIMGEFRPFGEDDMDPFGGIDLDFDADGNLIGIVEHDEPELPILPGQTPARPQPFQMSGAIQAGGEDQLVPPVGDDGPLILGEDALPDADAFAVHPSAKQHTASALHTSETTETVQAAAHLKKRHRRKVQTMLDQNDRVSRDEFRSWTEKYVENMEASHKRQRTTTSTQAKKNALNFLYGNGIAHVGVSSAVLGVAHPLADDFAGLPLKARLQGRLPEEMEDEVELRGRRRKSSEMLDDDEDEEQRQVKPRTDDGPEFGRGDPQELNEQLILGDDTAPEIGMEAAEAMEDHHCSSVMPWSRAGSAVPGSSVRGPGSAQKGMPAPSPLHGRGKALKPFERHSDPAVPMFCSDDFGQLRSQHSSLDLDGPVGEFEFGAGKDAQASGDGLDIASNEFLGYAMKHARDKVVVRHGDPGNRRWVDFETLANPETHTSDVAAQAFLHLLTLATHNVISLEQDGEKTGVPFGTIRVGIDLPGQIAEEVSDDELAE